MTFNRSDARFPAGRTGLRRRHPRAFTYAVLAMLLVSAFLLAIVVFQHDADSGSGPGALDGDTLATIAVFDVGQALSAAVITTDGASLVYDFGLTRDGTENVIIPFLRDHGVEAIDYAVLSHPHQDHLGGLPALLEGIPVDVFIDPVLETTNQTYLRSLQMIEERGIRAAKARRGDEYSLGEHAGFEILWPTDDLLTDGDGSHRLNDNSTVARVTVDQIQILLTGDIEHDAELALVDHYGPELRVDILQVAHHGSNTSSQDQFLEAARPAIGIIPVGADNQYGHPHIEVMQRLRRHDVEIYRTDVDGTITIQTDGKNYEISTSRMDQSWTIPASLRRWTTLKPTPMAGPLGFWSSMMVSN
jgi:competence protein ComEC